MAKPAIVTVDDDPQVLAAVRRDLRSKYAAAYRIVSASSGAEALEAAEKLKGRGDSVALFLVDQRMPQMEGTEFLALSRPLYPDAKRVLLTAYADTEVAIAAINEVGLDHYLMKPWDPPDENLYPILDDLLEDWKANVPAPFDGIRVAGTTWSPLTHELNNPAAAVRRGANQLRDAMSNYVAKVAALSAVGVDPGDDRVSELFGAGSGLVEPLDALARSDLEEELEDRLDELGVDEAWALVPELVDAGMTIESVDAVTSDFEADVVGDVLRACAAASGALGLLHEVEEGASRLSAIVGALKSYSYLDQAPVQEIDVTRGLDDTLLILKTKLNQIKVVREYAEDLLEIEAYGSELNQVWTNLIDNASYALIDGDVADPRIVLRVSAGDSEVVVEVEDNGPGIPDDIQERVFDSFFTTKPPGSGTGLGLDISYTIVANKHRGELTLESEPGRTTFKVTLPIEHQD